MDEDPKDIVREGYDRIGAQYDEYRDLFCDEDELKEFMRLVKPGGHILDAGCGAGIPIARILVENSFQVTGIDISQTMIGLAKQRVPEAIFKVGDMTSLEFDDATFDGIVSTYAVFHVPRTKHFDLFQSFHRILRKGGVFLFSIGVKPEGSDGVWKWDEFQSVPMFWSYNGPKKTIELLKKAEFEIIFARSVETGEETHFWILAKSR